MMNMFGSRNSERKESSSGTKQATATVHGGLPAGSVKTTLEVGNMTCSSCVRTIQTVLDEITGVLDAKVSLLANKAIIIHDPTVSPSAFASALTKYGYTSNVIDSSLIIQDQSAYRKPGNEQSNGFSVVFETEEMAETAGKSLFEFNFINDVKKQENSVIVAMKPFGRKSQAIRILEKDTQFGHFRVENHKDSSRKETNNVINEEVRAWRWRFLFSLISFVPIIVVSILTEDYNLISPRVSQWIQFLLATPVQVVVGFTFYRASYFALRKGRATMDVLIALSTSIAYFTSVYVVFSGLSSSNKTYSHCAMFKTSSMILTMLVLGKWLESAAKRRAASGVEQLSALVPDDAILYDEEEGVECETRVPISVLDVGDAVNIRPNSRVPVDGKIISGSSTIDESMLTGESVPVSKYDGESVVGGTLNGPGAIIIRASAVGEHSVLAQIISLVESAQMSRAPIEEFADFVSGIFVPTIVAISAVVFIVWYTATLHGIVPEEWYAKEGKFFFALLFSLETMVIACPCALGLATPTAVMVASEMGTRLGVLVRGGGAALQTAEKVQSVFFDKTGTLTKGAPEVVAVLYGGEGLKRFDDAETLVSKLVLAVEKLSLHPIANGIVKYVTEKFGEGSDSAHQILDGFKELPGSGVEASIDSGKYSIRVGSREWVFGEYIQESALLTNEEIESINRMEQELGLTIVVSVVNNSLVAIYGLEDSARSESAAVIQYLRNELEFEIGMVTGDSQRTAHRIAEQIGIFPDEIHARAKPEDKYLIVEKKLSSRTTAFVGDGINDAPALARADLGIAIGGGTSSIATNAADVVCVRGNLIAVAHTFWLSRVAFQRVRLNFMWAMGYNLVGIPFAAGVLYPFFRIRVPPFLASAAMSLSSISVILSSISLRWSTPPQIHKTSSSHGKETEENGLLVPLLDGQNDNLTHNYNSTQLP